MRQDVYSSNIRYMFWKDLSELSIDILCSKIMSQYQHLAEGLTGYIQPG